MRGCKSHFDIELETWQLWQPVVVKSSITWQQPNNLDLRESSSF